MHNPSRYLLIVLISIVSSGLIYAQTPRFQLVHYPDAPVLVPGFQHPFDTFGVEDPELFWDGHVFRMYYTATGTDGIQRIAAATSGNLMDWTPRGVVLAPEPGSFDRSGVSDPSLVQVNNVYHLFYTARNHDWKSIGRVSSMDGFNFENDRTVVLRPSYDSSRFDYLGVGEPSVIYQDGVFQLMYRGFDASIWWRLGFAISNDGIHFTRILEQDEYGANFGLGPHGFDDGGATEPEIWTDNNGNDVRLLYTSNHY